MPLHDWEFWVVSGASLLALLWVTRSVWKRRASKRTSVPLTIERRPK